jgi:hypothetical protein
MDKFKGLEGKIRKEIKKLEAIDGGSCGPFSNKRDKIETLEQVLKWIKELNDLEIVEADKEIGLA